MLIAHSFWAGFLVGSIIVGSIFIGGILFDWLAGRKDD